MQTRNAFTLIELIVVLVILIALSGVVLPLCTDNLSGAAATATDATLAEARDAMLQYWHDTKHIVLDGVASVATESHRFDIAWLFTNPITGDSTIGFDPNSRIGWNGPYIASSMSSSIASSQLVDGWNQSLTVQYVNPSDPLKDVRLVSAGPNGVVDISPASSTDSLTTNSIGDDRYVALSLR